MQSAHLFTPFELKDVTLRNRVAIAPMCQYSSEDGAATDWHFVHLGARAVGGAGLIVAEATAVTPEGRISPDDAGIWADKHVEPLARITRFLAAHGTVPGIQLAHAGRKAGTARPWEGGRQLPFDQRGWQAVGPSPAPFHPSERPVHELTKAEIAAVVQAFVDATRRSLAAGYRWLEIHGAHGYLAHSFASPISNPRTDEYGGSFDHRIRFHLEVTRAVRAVWPENLPLTWRLSATDWDDEAGGWTVADSVELSRRLKAEGVDFINVSTAGNTPHPKIPKLEPGYQVPFAEQIRREAGIPTGAVGLISDPRMADQIIRDGKADLVFLARASLRDPNWPIHAARELGEHEAAKTLVPPQYGRAFD